MNRLANSTSPYLLQHAANPVDWYEWGEAAFSEARRRDVPVFLSVGYSTCYWCHVMERESFESEATARVMNERFVCIKLDREQRPDIDDIYMAATQIMTGRGGWPMNVFLEPETLKPYYCGTYFPPAPRHGLPSFTQVLTAMSEAYAEQRDDVRRQAMSVADAVTEQLGSQSDPVRIGAEQVQESVGTLLKMADRNRGGFGGAPKFPQPAYLDLLLEVRAASDEPTRIAIDQVCRFTLDQMMLGGIHDQIGGGFHRYSVDAEWTVPHFEKMLYDNAQLASTYASAAMIYDDPGYAWVVRRTLDAVMRDLSHPGGGFFSAIDAEVDRREGLNYLWDADEVRAAVADRDDASWAVSVFGLDASPNFQDPHHPDEPPRFVLRQHSREPEPADAWRDRFGRVADLLFRVRSARKQPHTDDKVLTAWNGMMIKAFADGFALTRERAYLDRAVDAARFVQDQLRYTDEAGRPNLNRAWRDGRAEGPGVLEDSAHMIAALVAIDRAERSAGRASDDDWLSEATRLADAALDAFADTATGRLFDTRAGRPDLFVRAGSTYDGATPSAGSTMINALIDLSRSTGEPRFRDAAIRALGAISGPIAESPVATCNASRALFRVLRLGWPLREHLDAIGATPSAEAAPPGSPAGDKQPPEITPVEIYADAERLTVSDDAPAAVQLVLKIKDGFHIVAAKQPEGSLTLTPLRVELHGGTGAIAFADYPEGEPFRAPGVDEPIRVHTGDIEFPVLIERQGDPSGRQILTVSFQACTDAECLLPRTVELDVALDLV